MTDTSTSHSRPLVSISIVSHQQAGFVEKLLQDIAKHCHDYPLEIILTLNLPEIAPAVINNYFCPVKSICNESPKGFGENHNQAFIQAEGKFFCVLNPDARLLSNPFPPLLRVLDDRGIGLVAPMIVNSDSEPEDSMRCFPSPVELVGKFLGRPSNKFIHDSSEVVFPDWVAGMFMLFPHELFSKLNGFDTRYFLYYEDVDICARLRLQGYRVAVSQNVSVIHDAQRTSHRNFRYLKWHLASVLRFFSSPVYRQLRKHSQRKRQGDEI